MKENPTKIAYDAKTGKRRGNAFAWFPGIDMVLTHNTSYVLTQQGIYAINRAGYAQAVKKTGQLTKERKALAKELAKLRMNNADLVKSNKKINLRIDEITSRLAVINKEEGVLKKSCLRWHYAGEGFASLIMANRYRKCRRPGCFRRPTYCQYRQRTDLLFRRRKNFRGCGNQDQSRY